MKIGRNQLCSCGSGKKYKRCCINKPEPNPGRVNVVTFLTHEEVFPNKTGSLQTNLQNLSPIDTVASAAFANMVMQTTGFQEAQRMQFEEAKSYYTDPSIRSKFEVGSKILVTRDAVLQLMANLVMINNTSAISLNPENPKKVIETILLINSSYSNSSEFELERMLIRNPPYMNPQELEWFYKHNFLRYLRIYTNYSIQLNQQQIKSWQKVEAEFKTLTGVTLIDYMKTLKQLFVWYLVSRNNGNDAIPGFKLNNPQTFYIEKKNFSQSPTFLASLEILGKNLNDLHNAFQVSKPFSLDNETYKYYPYIFDNPVFKVEENKFCILDLTYLMENACGGLMFKLFALNRSNLNNNMQEFKGIYGNLLDTYFGWLVTEIFGTDATITIGNTGKQDALINVIKGGKEYFLVLEFCTRYYRFQSLYNSSLDSWKEDIDNILFNTIKDGKFAKLNNYIEVLKSTNPNAEFIPILVTEKYLGDYDLINRHDSILDKGIQNNSLVNLQKNKPIILDLLDIESFWAGSTEGNESLEFLNELLEWERSDKGKIALFRFLSFTGNPAKNKRMNNEKYLSMFNIKNLFQP